MIIGLTGGIASGKSTVSRYLQSKGIPVCDTDELARKVVLPGTKGLQQLIETFGLEIIDEHGALNRDILAEKVFGDPQALNQLNRILHPLIFEEVEAFKKQYTHEKIIVIDMPLLFETGYLKKVDRIMVIFVDDSVQYERLIKRNGLTPQQAKKRIDAQLSLSEKVKQAHIVIDNNGDLSSTYRQIDECLKRLNYDIIKA